ncbi:MAG: methyltransferase domain-containing protein [Nocardioidaceae bacterium]|nr:methyltransferase domain-containing protein [Nocardioidaceae bacterium]
MCRSCTLMGTPYAEQLTALSGRTREVLGEVIPPEAWLPAVANTESGFRNKAKLVVGGRRGAPTLGILDGSGNGVDLRHCGLYEPGLAEAVLAFADFVGAAGFTPYDVGTRSGELKHLILTHSPNGELMARFVFRSEGQIRKLADRLGELPGNTRVVTANLQPEHKAVLEGEQELVLSEQTQLPMPVNDVVLQLGPRSFFQTSTPMAARLYATAREWVAGIEPTRVADLYCGVGGFAHHLAAPGRQVQGVELSAAAVESARLVGTPGVSFAVADADRLEVPEADLVVVNPPRRGIGELAQTLEGSGVERILYSSCNPRSLAADLARLASYEVERARLFDMFPQTEHAEVLVSLRLI